MDGKNCSVCGAACTSKCGKCRARYYCSREHQAQDWKTHKSECRALDSGKSGEGPRPVNMVYVGPGENSGYSPDSPESNALATLSNAYSMQLAFPHIKDLGNKVKEYHRRGERCFISVEIEQNERGSIPGFRYVVRSAEVRTDPEDHATLVKSRKLNQYFINYEMESQISVVIWCRNPDACYTCLILQPWET